MAVRARSRSKKRGGRRKGASSRARSTSRARRRNGSGPVRTAGRSLARHLSPRATEAVGIGLVIFAVLGALGLWFDAGGPFGRLLQIGVEGLFGPAGFAVPVLAAYWGVLLLKGSARDDRGRMLVGLVLAASGVLGILSVGGGYRSPAAGYRQVSGAAGGPGAVVGWS